MRMFNRSAARCALGMVALASILTTLFWTRSAAAQAPSPQAWVLHNVNVVDTRTGRIARNSAILIDAGRIVRVGPARTFRAPGLRRMDGRGAYVVPGYNDMHAHPLNDPDPRANLSLMLANGITGFRQMSGSPELLAARRAGRLNWPNAPQVLALSGTILTPANALFPPSATTEMQAQQQAGADFIKAVILPPPTFMAVLAESRRLGIPVAGHLPDGIDVRQAAQGGMRSLEHYGGGQDSFLMSCSRDEERLRAEAAAEARSLPPPVNLDLNNPAALARVLANPVLARAQRGYARTAQVVDSFDLERCRAVARLIAERQFWQVPTLIRIRTMQISDDPAYRGDPNLRYVSPGTRQLWTELADAFPRSLSGGDRQSLTRLFRLQLRLTKILDEAGVPMLAGSDFGGMWLVAGFSLHQEFDLLAEAGLSPLKILQMTTLNAGRFLGRETLGTVEAGRDADLVLLVANPITSHRNLRRINGVVRAGAYHGRRELDAMMAAAAGQVRTGPPAVDNHGH